MCVYIRPNARYDNNYSGPDEVGYCYVKFSNTNEITQITFVIGKPGEVGKRLSVPSSL
jgi:hypothetical protein